MENGGRVDAAVEEDAVEPELEEVEGIGVEVGLKGGMHN